MNKEKILEVLRKYLPKDFEYFVFELLKKHKVQFKIVAPRKTKLGDFRISGLNEKPQITINNNLNPYSFLVTTVHEFAHLITFAEFGRSVKPHGFEWKETYGTLLFEMINYASLPKEIEIALLNSLTNVKASSCNDIEVYRVLKKYNKDFSSFTLNVESLSNNATFVYGNQEYRLLNKRRTRYLCEHIETKKKYLFHALTEIKKINE